MVSDGGCRKHPPGNPAGPGVFGSGTVAHSAIAVPPRGLSALTRGGLTQSRSCPGPLWIQMLLTCGAQHAGSCSVVTRSREARTPVRAGFLRVVVCVAGITMLKPLGGRGKGKDLLRYLECRGVDGFRLPNCPTIDHIIFDETPPPLPRRPRSARATSAPSTSPRTMCEPSKTTARGDVVELAGCRPPPDRGDR